MSLFRVRPRWPDRALLSPQQWKGATRQATVVLSGPHRIDVWRDFDHVEAAALRAEGQRLIELAEVGAFPFDGTYVDFKPDPAWSPLGLPTGWDRPSPAA